MPSLKIYQRLINGTEWQEVNTREAICVLNTTHSEGELTQFLSNDNQYLSSNLYVFRTERKD